MLSAFSRYRPIINLTVVIIAPLVFSPLLAKEEHFKCFYILILMATFWLTNVVPIAVTAMLPLLLCPLLKISPSSIITAAYSSDSLFLSFGRLFIACAFQQHKVQTRMTLMLLSIVTPQMKWVMLAFMVSSYTLSLFISNNASAAIMLDIVVEFTTLLRVIEVEADTEEIDNLPCEIAFKELQKSLSSGSIPKRKSGIEMRQIIVNKRLTVTSIQIHVKEDGITKRETVILQEKRLQNISTALALATTYSATVAAAGSMVACGPNLIFYGFIQKNYNYDTTVNYASFLLFGFPVGIVCLLVVWLWVGNLYLGPREFFSRRETYGKEKRLREKIRQQYADLGPITHGEVMSVLLTLVLLLLWFTRKYNDWGWKSYFQVGVLTYVTDVQPMMFIVFLLFVLPTKFVLEKMSNGKFDMTFSTLLSWTTVLKHFNWSSLFLLGSGFAVTEICKTSQLTNLVADSLYTMSDLSVFPVMLMSSIFCTTATEFLSSTTLYPVLLPILMCLAQMCGINPLKYGLSLTLSSSFAFCTPIATSPNIAAFNKNLAKPMDFLRTGILLDVIFAFLICFFVLTYGSFIFDLGKFPQWANSSNSNCSVGY